MSLSEFRIIGNGISLYEPQLKYDSDGESGPAVSGANPGTGKRIITAAAPPKLIIMCTWLGGATDKRIQRYTQGYHSIWPTARILLIRTSNAEYAFHSSRYLRRKLRPAIHAIRKINDNNASSGGSSSSSFSSFPSTSRGTLLHIFSNGGAYVATQLVTSMNAVLDRAGPMPLRQIVFDSCPGGMTVDRGYQAAARALPPSPLRPLGRAALYLTVLSIVGSENVGIKQPLCATVQALLNDPHVFAPQATRVYLTSTADDTVYTDEVLAHRDEAAVRGYRTETVVFGTAAHCALIREDETTYWRTIASAWDKREDSSPMAIDGSDPAVIPTPATAWREGGGGIGTTHPQRAVLMKSRL